MAATSAIGGSGPVGVLAVAPAVLVAAAAVVVIVGWRHRRRRAGWPAVAAGAGSLTATAATVWLRPDYGEAAGNLGLAECALMLTMIAIAIRWAPPRQAVAAAVTSGVAVSVCVLRFLPAHSLIEVIGASALWAAGPLIASVIGGYPRLADVRRRRSVALARRAQRLSLARDLHDFVAHDVSGIVVQAQSARFAATEPGQLLDALARIEAAGLQALAVMDRTVEMLREADDSPDSPATDALPGLAELPGLLDRFADTGPIRLEASLDSDLTHPPGRVMIPPEVGATAYRVVTEALTNVRRHAVAATVVRVVVERLPGPAVAITVTNDDAHDGSHGGPPARRRPGRPSGLVGLQERVRLLGGDFTAGAGDQGWRVTATLPLQRS